MTGFFEYFKNFSLNEKLLACALYKEADIIFKNNPVWRVNGNLRIAGLVEELNLNEDMRRNAQLSRGVWENMSKENKIQFINSFVDMMDIVTYRLEDVTFVQALANSGISKDGFFDMMAWRLGFLIDEVMSKIDVVVVVDVKNRKILV